MQLYNPEPLDDVFKIVHDYMDFHTIGTKIEMTTTKILTWFRKILIKKKSHAAKVIQELFRSILNRDKTNFHGTTLSSRSKL